MDCKIMDISLEYKESKIIKVVISLTNNELSNYKTFVIQYQDILFKVVYNYTLLI